MHDEQAFWAAIIAAPDDPMPRLIFADALRDAGRERQAAFMVAWAANRWWPMPWPIDNGAQPPRTWDWWLWPERYGMPEPHHGRWLPEPVWALLVGYSRTVGNCCREYPSLRDALTWLCDAWMHAEQLAETWADAPV